jgi:hypothetical protein
MQWFLILGQIGQAIDVTTAAGAFALVTMHLHTAVQTVQIKRHVDREIASKMAEHEKAKHS